LSYDLDIQKVQEFVKLHVRAKFHQWFTSYHASQTVTMLKNTATPLEAKIC